MKQSCAIIFVLALSLTFFGATPAHANETEERLAGHLITVAGTSAPGQSQYAARRAATVDAQLSAVMMAAFAAGHTDISNIHGHLGPGAIRKQTPFYDAGNGRATVTMVVDLTRIDVSFRSPSE